MILTKLVYEDVLSGLVLRKLLSVNSALCLVGTHNKHGFGGIKKHILGYNAAAEHLPFIVLTDLDTHPCPPDLIKEWGIVNHHRNLIFRIAVHATESWLLADREGFAKYLGINPKNIPLSPDSILDPKQKLLSLVEKSRKRDLKEDILPRYRGDKFGPDYNGRLGDFVQNFWDASKARLSSRSLDKAIKRIEEIR